MQTYRLHIQGIVQGVGFRPFIKNLADEMQLMGEVCNTSDGVVILVSCDSATLDKFISNIHSKHPPLAQILDIAVSTNASVQTYENFSISKSQGSQGVTAVSPDMAMCDDCKAEISSSEERRYQYAFTNCTNCGSRYSIIEKLPYDRPHTVMCEFEMCDYCKAQYENQADRRYHAQPIACPHCGPEVYISHGGTTLKGVNAIKYVADKINAGEIVAIKGLGGYHIVCDATNSIAVSRLRTLKNRGTKPFAIMCRDIASISEHVETSETFQQLITSKESPIVIFDWANNPLASEVNTTSNKIGIMRAYTPLHYILFSYLDTKFIVATSGNAKDEPIAKDEQTAEQTLSMYTDIFLHHNRRIHTAIDDSVVAMTDKSYMVLRRARGYAPSPVLIKGDCDKQLYAAGANLKSSIALYKQGFAFLSQYIGDLDNIETEQFYSEIYGKMCDMFAISPDVALRDVHPTYRSSMFADSLALHTHEYQHHKAHFMSCLAENMYYSDAIGVVLDGFGIGDDGKAWGGEFFTKVGNAIERVAHLKNYVQAGLDSSTKHPVRMAFSYIYSMGLLDEACELLQGRLAMSEQEQSLLKYAIDNRVNSIETSSAGRLFEAVGSLVLGERSNNYEGELAINLENIADKNITSSYEFTYDNGEIDFREVIKSILIDIKQGEAIGAISAKFHNGMVNIIVHVCEQLRREHGISTVALSGGVFQNIMLLNGVTEKLEQQGFTVLVHKNIPSNDACIALGQIYGYVAGIATPGE